MTEKRDDRPFQFSLLGLMVVVTVICFIVASPTVAMELASSAALFTLGLACAHGAARNRVPGWIEGFVFGLVMLAAGFFGGVLTIALILENGWGL